MIGRNLNKFIFALILIGLGVGLLLSNFGVIEVDIGDLVSDYWPVFMIWVGLSIILSGLKYGRGFWGASIGSLIVGGIILLLGWNFLAGNLGWNTVDFGFIWTLFWPLLLIYIGIKVLFRKKGSHFKVDLDFDPFEKKHHKHHSDHVNHEDIFTDGIDAEPDRKIKRVYRSSLIGDINMGREPFELENLHLWNGIGDVDLNLSKAILPEGEAKILIAGWIGDIDVIVPKDMAIWVEAHIRIGEIRLMGNSEGGISKEQHYKSPGYDEAFKKVHMIIDLKIGDVRVVER